ncbi:MAG: metal-dependent hydrolase [Pleurocapsa sp.]
MPSPLAHGVSGYIITKFSPLKRPQESKVNQWYVQSLYPVFVAISADLDFIPQIITGDNYHRGLTHSILFGLIFSVITGFIVSHWSKYSYRKIFLLTAIAYGSHLVLDFFTAGGDGMELLWPITDSFFKSPLPIFPAVHHSRGLWHYSHLIPLSFELAYSALLFLGMFYWQKFSYGSENNN